MSIKSKVISKLKNISSKNSTAESDTKIVASETEELPEVEITAPKRGIFSKAKTFLKDAKSEAVDAVKNPSALNAAVLAGKVALKAKESTNIFTSDFERLRSEGKVTQDVLDAVLCENSQKLQAACNAVFEAEKSGKPLNYLSEDEIKSALSIRKAVIKSVVHKVLG